MKTPIKEISRRSKLVAVPPAISPFTSIDALLEAAGQMFSVRQKVISEKAECTLESTKKLAAEREWYSYWHCSFTRTGDEIELCRCSRKHRLNRLEREILTALILERMGMLKISRRSCSDIVQALERPGDKLVKIIRCMSEQGRLFKAKLISYEDEDEDLCERRLVVDPGLVDSIIYGKAKYHLGWPVKSEGELLDRLCFLTRALQKKSDALEGLVRGHGNEMEFCKFSRKADRLGNSLDETLALHSDWRISNFLNDPESGFKGNQRTILLTLLGKELGHLSANDTLFQGGGLARAVSSFPEHVPHCMRYLKSDSNLITGGLIQPCGGEESLLTNDPRSLENIEFELTGKCLDLLGIDKKLAKNRAGGDKVRAAKMRMEQLVLSEAVQEALQMALTQSRHADVLVQEWGLGELIPYRRAVVILFSGPPGVGKTACAEAMAHELDKPILTADYSEIQNCFVGNTEKNIVRIFRDARRHDALLFWDEADAMFYDRDSANHNWEVRDVNVLLQELEKFQGICILSTNRKITLDKALERRIAIKIEFAPPDRELRRRIWQKLLPKKLPLAKDVDVERLANEELTGGEIKNAVLNAARMGLCRGPKSKINMKDFQKAIQMETTGKWTGDKRIGFRG
ncbi:MAG: ATP-binding protein [Planctomycetes bacterium]|nr:ATP-binding protein [Planctomycetota bacterium]